MSKYEPDRLAERLLDACMGVALAAVALFAAVWLVQQVWPWLVGMAAVVGAVVIGAWWLRRW